MKNKIFLSDDAIEKNGKYFLDKPSPHAVLGPTYLGEEIENVFYPSYFCLELYSKDANTLLVNTNNGWHFTLGKALAFDSVLKETVVNSKPYFVVKNGNNEILGVAEKKQNSYYNIYDIGYFLRRELD